MGFHHQIQVRYGEVDQQGVVFNAHYLAWIDDAMDRWMRLLDADFESLGWDFMVRHAELDWLGGATVGDTVDLVGRGWSGGAAPRSWSGVVATVGERRVMEAEMTYVGVEAGTTRPGSAAGRGPGAPGRMSRRGRTPAVARSTPGPAWRWPPSC